MYAKSTQRMCGKALTYVKVFALSDLTKPIYVAEGLSFLPPILSADYAARRGTSRETLKELIVADLGDNTASFPYLVVSSLCGCLSFGLLMNFRLGTTRTT